MLEYERSFLLEHDLAHDYYQFAFGPEKDFGEAAGNLISLSGNRDCSIASSTNYISDRKGH